MYDICIIGGGIIGKYLADKLKGRNCVWISSEHTQYQSKEVYKLDSYLGRKDTWQEKATGLISFPSAQDIEKMPFSSDQYEIYKQQLIDELAVYSLDFLLEDSRYRLVHQKLTQLFPGERLESFHAAHPVRQGPSFETREPYDRYWFEQKPKWAFMSGEPEEAHVDYLMLVGDRAVAAVTTDRRGVQKVIEAKQFILAAHTPGNLGILERTYAYYRRQSLVGGQYSDHAQLSFGLLLPGTVIPRECISGAWFQDREVEGQRYRLEFHLAPPRQEMMELCLRRLPQFSQSDFFHNFFRMVAVAELPALPSMRLSVSGRNGNSYMLSKEFYQQAQKSRTVLLKEVRKQFLTDSPIVLLNRHHPLYYGGHLIGGLSYPDQVDENLRLREITNISIGGSAVFPSAGLHNPTFTMLVMAKHLLRSLVL